MRLFDDTQGQRWEAAAAFGSYGEVRLIFACMDGDELRSSAMQARTLREAEEELTSLGDDALRERLQQAETWQG